MVPKRIMMLVSTCETQVYVHMHGALSSLRMGFHKHALSFEKSTFSFADISSLDSFVCE
jgi:hypothetical protein